MKVLDGQGEVILEDSYGGDLSIVNAARQSYGKRTEGLGPSDVGLIHHLMKHRHGTPFEMVDFRFSVTAPIFVVREWQRHRIASYNEMSGRYVELPGEFYIPPLGNMRTQTGKPGAYTFDRMIPADARECQGWIVDHFEACWEKYQALLMRGVAKEVARIVLPLGLMTKFTFKINLRSLFNFISLRAAPNALQEIREYAVAIDQLARPIAPVAFEAFDKVGQVAP